VFLKKKDIAFFLGLSVCLLNNADALDVGEIQVHSYIGQPLSLFVPITEIDTRSFDFSQLIISKPDEVLLSSSGNRKISVQDYKITKDSSMNGIYITTEKPINETFIDFALKFNYKGVSQLNKFTVLIDLESNLPSSSVNSASSSLSKETSVLTNSSDLLNNSETMGPYDWAEKGNIAEKFGPVLDGQSLWRVARRINTAMSVSVDQMMWALYRSNKNAFQSDNVSSLLSGSILTIPNRAFVVEFSERASNRLVNNVQAASYNSTVLVEGQEIKPGSINTDTPFANPISIVSSVAPSSIDKSLLVSEALVEESETSNLLVTDQNLNNSDQLLFNNEITNDAIANVEFEQGISLSQISVIEQLQSEIISLNEKVLIQSERISLLEQRIEGFESINGLEVGVAIQGDGVNPTAVIASKPLKNVTFVNPLYVIGAVIIALMAFFAWLAYLNRYFIGRSVERLSNGSIEFDEDSPSFFYAFSKRRQLLRTVIAEEDFDHSGGKDSDVNTQKSDVKKDEFDDDFLIDGEYESHVEELSFPERINQLIDEGEFEEAKKVMKFASELDFEEGYLNLCLLKIFMAQSDNERFAKLFSEIKSNMDSYSNDIQLQISELQAEMTVEDIIEYSQEKFG
jgi:FimV-like protein